MEKLNVGNILIHKATGQEGKVEEVGQGGKVGVFRATTGARFSVAADELAAGDWKPDVFDELERMLLTTPKQDVKMVWRSAA